VPDKPRSYRTRAKNAQEAHEGIRPTSARRLPEAMKAHLDGDQYKLYELIWRRTVACQMKPALIDTVTVDLECNGGHRFRANGSTIAHPGFLQVYEEGSDDVNKGKGNGDGERELPPLQQGEQVKLQDIRNEQHFTQPPPRYSEASLVRALEEHGIGRPSTYASILSTLRQREYVEMENKRFIPTDTGRMVSKFLSAHFDRYTAYNFTARLENELDAIARGEKEWVPVMERFWKNFSKEVKEKDSSVTRRDASNLRELGTDPDTGLPVYARLGRYGPFVQLGSADDEKKPRFASLLPGQRVDSVTLDEALLLFALPRELGKTEDGEVITANQGRYGPYLRYGERKNVSLQSPDDPYTITRERALEVIAEHRELQRNRHIKQFEGSNVVILRGRYGPYITDGEKNARIPKDKEPEALSLEESLELLKQSPPKRRKAAKTRKRR